MRLILIGNFLSDGQESMQRFAHMLSAGFQTAGHQVEIWYPRSYFSFWSKSTLSGMGKWLGYLDKWIIFPAVLKFKLWGNANRSAYYHICDHSNAPYLQHLPIDRTSITCHDVLAIQAGMGMEGTYCKATRFGKLYQKWIFNSLIKARHLAAVSGYTLNQLHDILPDNRSSYDNWKIIHNAFNAEFGPMPDTERTMLLEKCGIQKNESFVLHVGSALPRKNRRLLLDMMSKLGEKWSGNVCFGGQALDKDFLAYAEKLGVSSSIISVVKPDHKTLVALYSSCEAFIFPSFSEGFGWPIIEAQACGAPVIASSIDPFPEVSGGAALLADPEKPDEFASALIELKDQSFRKKLISDGFENCRRFDSKKTVEKYLTLMAH